MIRRQSILLQENQNVEPYRIQTLSNRHFKYVLLILCTHVTQHTSIHSNKNACLQVEMEGTGSLKLHSKLETIKILICFTALKLRNLLTYSTHTIMKRIRRELHVNDSCHIILLTVRLIRQV